MSTIRKIAADEIDAFIPIAANAYPGIKINSAEDRERLKQRMLAYDPISEVNLYGLYRDGALLGGMLLHDFTMQLLSIKAPAGGLGFVAVDLVHKKEHVAKELIEFYLRHYHERGTTIAVLYPFRPDFYKQMGFGYGTKMHSYRIKPSSLPRGPSKEHITFIDAADKQQLLDCYHRFVGCNHGMITRLPYEGDRIFSNPENRIVAFKRDGVIEGYAIFAFKLTNSDNFLQHDIQIREFIYEHQTALLELLTFLHTQFDQVDRIIFNTQDEYFHHLLSDPRNGAPTLYPHVYHESNVQGVGLMYRVLDTAGVLRVLSGHDFGGQTCKLKISIEDSFFSENNGSTVVHFKNGIGQVVGSNDYEVSIRMGVSEFSSMLVGVIPFKQLCRYGLAEISDTTYIDTVSRLFAAEQKPICMTPF